MLTEKGEDDFYWHWVAIKVTLRERGANIGVRIWLRRIKHG